MATQKKKPAKTIRKKASSVWQPGFMQFRQTYDAFQSLPEPTKVDLVRAYEDITYACVSLIARNIACVPLRLYVKQGQGKKAKYPTKKPHEKAMPALKRKGLSTTVAEVVEHPLLELVQKCNPWHNKHDLLGLTQIYLDLTGNAYWLMQFNLVGIPEQLYLLPSQYMIPERNNDYFIVGWKFGQGMEQKTYTPKEVLHFKEWNPLDPYGEGMSPLRGAWQRRIIGSKELAYLDNVLSNQARPDGILAIKDSIAPFEGERLAKEFQQRFTNHGEGGILVTDGTMNYSPINYAPKDLAELQLFQTIRATISNCFHIPPEIWELGESNRATADTAEYLLALRCLKPRLDLLTERLNNQLVPFFDERFFFMADPVVPEDKDFELSLMSAGLQSGSLTRQEWRDHYGYTPEKWASEPLLPSGVLPAGTFDEPLPTTPASPPREEAPEAPEAPAEPITPEQAPATASNDLRATVGGSVAIADLQRSYYRRELPREAAVANAVLIFGFTDKEAERLFPELSPNAPTNETPASPETSPASPPASGEEQQRGKSRPCGCARHKGNQDEEEVDLPPHAEPELKETVEECVAAKLPAYLEQGLSQDEAIAAAFHECSRMGLTEPEESPEAKAFRLKAFKQKSPLPLIRALQGFFKSQASEVLKGISTKGVNNPENPESRKALPPDWFNIDDWTREMYLSLRPMILMYYEHGSKAAISNLGVSDSLFSTVQPNLKEGVDKATLLFCEDTNKTTSIELDKALTMLREEITQGLIEGDVKNAMMERVQKVFEGASNERAFRIGVTEASRGQHAGLEITAQESGVAKGKTWLLSSDACDLCKPLSGKSVELGANFLVDGEGPYSEIPYPPRHPNCRCTILLDT